MEPIKEAETVGKDIRTIHPVQKFLLLDVLRDKESRLVIYWVLAVLVLGTLVYHWLEGWSYLDALYFCVISLATIGYGDLAPTTPEAKIFTIIYVINGIAILLALFDRVRVVRPNWSGSQPVVEKHDES
jgi:voltage-gated potassium channel